YAARQTGTIRRHKEEATLQRRLAWRLDALRDDLSRAERQSRAGNVNAVRELAREVARGAADVAASLPHPEEAWTVAGRARELAHDFGEADDAYAKACAAAEPIF